MELPTSTDAILSRIYGDYRKLARYLGVGVITTLVDWVIFYLLIRYLYIFYLLALALSYFTSTILSFSLNKRYTFRNKFKKAHYQLLLFVAVAATGLALNEALVYSLVHFLFGSNASFGLMASRIIATIIVFLWNFALNKRITFKIFQ